jgi:hypothetical protein
MFKSKTGKLRNNMLRSVRKAMEKTETHIHAQEIILHGIKATINHGIETVAEEDISFQPSGAIKLALKEQNAIGWTNFTTVTYPKMGTSPTATLPQN